MPNRQQIKVFPLRYRTITKLSLFALLSKDESCISPRMLIPRLNRRIVGAPVLLGCAFLIFFTSKIAAQESVSRVLVSAEAIPSSYGAPPGFSRTRTSPTTTSYVLPPWSFFSGTIYEGAVGEGLPDHMFTQEVEMGLPYRFGVAAEVAAERFNGGGGVQTISLEGRWALADWNKIPLNPTIFAEYKFGVGTLRHEEGEEPPAGEEGEEEEEEFGPPDVPDAYEFRLLLAQDFGEKVEWAFNAFFEQETSGDEGREWGFAQDIAVPLLPEERLRAGVEMIYTNFTVKNRRGSPTHSFNIGPTAAWKPTRATRLDVSTLFGATEDSPDVRIFAIFSWVFGGTEERQAEGPASTRNR